MQVKNITVGVVAAVCFVFLAKLMMDAQASRDVEVDEVALGRAVAEFKKGEKQGAKPSTTIAPIKARNKIRSKSSDETTPKEKSQPKSAVSPSIRAPSFISPTTGLNKAISGDGGERVKMNRANSLYDQADYEGARESALEILEESPENVRMLRIVVSSSCIMGDADLATKFYENLPKRDQKQMRGRCKRYGIDMDE